MEFESVAFDRRHDSTFIGFHSGHEPAFVVRTEMHQGVHSWVRAINEAEQWLTYDTAVYARRNGYQIRFWADRWVNRGPRQRWYEGVHGVSVINNDCIVMVPFPEIDEEYLPPKRPESAWLYDFLDQNFK